MVDCNAGVVAATIEGLGGEYVPAATTIALGATVRFAMADGLEVQAGTPAAPTELFYVAPDATACFTFNEVGSYAFHSTTHNVGLRHNITGSLTVE